MLCLPFRIMGVSCFMFFLDELRAAAEGARQIQMNVFDTHASADQDEFLAKFDDVRWTINYRTHSYLVTKETYKISF